MKFKISRHYIRDVEILFAEFNDLDHAKQFIEIKIAMDEIINVKIIYRIFDDNQLYYEFNKWKDAPLSGRLSFDDEGYKFNDFLNQYKITQQSNNQNEIHIAEFDNINDAQIFIEHLLMSDSVNRIDHCYRIYNKDVFLDEFNQDTFNKSQQQSKVNTKKLVFRPTPLPLAPRLGPPKYLFDEDDDENDNKSSK